MIYFKIVLSIFGVFLLKNSLLQNFYFFTHDFYNKTVCEYLPYSISRSSALHEDKVGVCKLHSLSDKFIYVFTLYSLKGLWDVCLWFFQPAHVNHN